METQLFSLSIRIPVVVRSGSVKVEKRTVVAWKSNVEELIAARKQGRSPYEETSEWLARLSDDWYAKLARVGLVEERKVSGPITLAAFLDGFIENRSDLSPNSVRNLANSRGRLVAHFGASKIISTITPGDADDWRQGMVNSGRIGPATISKAVKHAKQFFRAAERKSMVKSNPFADLRAGGECNKERQFFVGQDVVDRVIAAAPDLQWKLIVALSRYAGLRCPSKF